MAGTTTLVCTRLELKDRHREALREAVGGGRILYEPDPAPEQLAQADFIFGNVKPELLRHCRKLRLLQLNSAEADAYVGRRDLFPEGAVLATVSGAYGRSVGEHMLAQLLAVMKRLDIYSRDQSGELWRDAGPVGSIGGSVVLVVGLGDIGSCFARLAGALGGKVIGVRRVGIDKPECVDELYLTGELDRLIPRADVVALCLPSTAQTRGILSRERIGRMKRGAYVVNAGRGDAIDQEALCDALDAGRLAGAALDVTDPEPLPAGHRLWKTPGAFITPHVSGGFHLPCTGDKIVEIAARNLRAAVAGEPVVNRVDFETGYRMP